MRMDAKDSTVLKGLAILAVVLHNYFHMVSPVKENEFCFDPSRFHALLAMLREPTEAIQAFFSYFGHFGVQVFIFLSAYGLAVKYWDTPESRLAFLWQRVERIYPAFLTAIFCWPLFLMLRDGPDGALVVLRAKAVSLLLTVFGVQNLVPHEGLPPVGPWWFIPFILQFYFFWPDLRRWVGRTGAPGLIILSAASLLLTYCCNDVLVARWNINLLETPVGHLPEICMGIAAARYGFAPGRRLVAIAAGTFLLANLDRHFWLLGFSSCLVLILAAYAPARTLLRRSKKLAIIGGISMELFLVNGFVRPPFVELVLMNHFWLFELALSATATMTAIWVATYVYRMEVLRTRMLHA